MVDYSLVLAVYGGDNENGRKRYRNQLIADISEGLDVKGDIFVQSILGGDVFIEWVKESFLEGKELREYPSADEIRLYKPN